MVSPYPPEMPSHTDRTIDPILSTINHDKPLAEHGLINVYTVASVDYQLPKFRTKIRGMDAEQLIEDRYYSRRLASNLNKIDPKPHKDCQAHHIVSGGHPRAQRTRLFLAAYGRHMDDPINGAWLPRNIEVRLKCRCGLERLCLMRTCILKNIIIGSIKKLKTIQLKIQKHLI